MRVMAEERAHRRYQQGLEVEPQALAHMRRIAADHLRLWGHGPLIDSVTLGLTEMLANVRRHTGSLACVLTLEDIGTGVRLTVSDASTETPVLRELDWSAECGRGMRLIAEAASSFGATVTEAGKDVWAVFREDRETAA